MKIIAVHNQTVVPLVSIIKDWIPPGTVIISDCWASHSTLYIRGYSHKIVNYSITFVKKTARAHTNTITWRHLKASLNTCHRNTGYILYPAQYTFRMKCKAENTVTL